MQFQAILCHCAITRVVDLVNHPLPKMNFEELDNMVQVPRLHTQGLIA